MSGEHEAGSVNHIENIERLNAAFGYLGPNYVTQLNEVTRRIMYFAAKNVNLYDRTTENQLRTLFRDAGSGDAVMKCLEALRVYDGPTYF